MKDRQTLHSELEAFVQQCFAQSQGIGLMAGIILDAGQPQETIWTIPAGRIAVAPTAAAPNADTFWQIGSMTKTFTAAALAAATIESDDIHLTDAAQIWAPPAVALPTDASDQKMRLVDLATHSSGLCTDPRGVGAHGYSVGDMYRYLDLYALAPAPGSFWNYSNLGFGLLANLLMRRAGTTDYQILVDRLLAKARLPLNDTKIHLDPARAGRMAQGYAAPGQPAVLRSATWPAFDGSGALCSTIGDMVEWIAFHLGGRPSPLAGIIPLVTDLYFRSAEHKMGLAWDQQALTAAAHPSGSNSA